MVLLPLQKHDFNIRSDIRVDVGNRGFSDKELEMLAGPSPSDPQGTRGEGSWWQQVWKRNRQVPPERQNLKSEFGYQSNPLLTDLITVAKAQGTVLEGLIKAQCSNYNFYILRCGVYIVPHGEEKFEALKFEVHYKDNRASTHTMLPGPQTKKILELGGKAEIGVDGKAEFGFPDVSLGAGSVDLSAKVKLDAKFIISFAYELKTPVVDSFGIGNPFCKWLMHKGDDLRNDVVFYPIIMTPKSVRGFGCEFRAYFIIKHPNWHNSEIYENPPLAIAVSAGPAEGAKAFHRC
jgi:hypothetical protein